MASTTYVLHKVVDLESIEHLYWGPRLEDKDIENFPRKFINERPYISFESRAGLLREEIIPWGELRFQEPTTKVLFGDGTRVLNLSYQGFSIAQEDDSYLLTLSFVDKLHPKFSVEVFYQIYERSDVLSRWMVLKNSSVSDHVVIEQAYSANWNVPTEDEYRATYLTGKWGMETQVAHSMLGRGKFVLESRRGTTSHQSNPFLALDVSAEATETMGRVWAMALGWSGSWKIVAEKTPYNEVHITMGINEWDSPYSLEPGSQLVTPEAYGAFSQQGFGGISHKFHDFQMRFVIPKTETQVMPVLYNSWEATEFKVSSIQQLELAKQAAQLGIELFVIDDGWFGQRHTDHTGLGDWIVNREKFPQGLTEVSNQIHTMGMMFGLWVEPEMVNADSDLYRKHPEWVYHFPNIPQTPSRNQMILNMAREDIANWTFQWLDELISKNSIDFIKWDMNRHFSEPGWPSQSHNPERIWIEHPRNVYRIIDRLRIRHPNLVIESCSGGGGRIDMGMLKRVDQVWTSDNTDAFDRVLIQEGFSMIYPSRVMMDWVTDSPNFLTKRALPLAFRFHVAMMGGLGIGGNLKHWSQKELMDATGFIQQYKQIRPIIQQGMLFRLASLRNGPIGATQYMAKGQASTVLFIFSAMHHAGSQTHTLRLRGLNPSIQYTEKYSGQKYQGRYLMEVGLSVTLSRDFDSHLFWFNSSQ